MTAFQTALVERVRAFEPALRLGRLTRISSTYLEADGPDAPIGSICALEGRDGDVLATVVGIDTSRTVLAPLDLISGIRLWARVRLVGSAVTPLTGDGFLDRVVDGLGRPIDGGPAIQGTPAAPGAIGPLRRISSRAPVTTGMRAIDGLLALAQGQRIGIFAAPGVGKTTLLTQLASQVEADRTVICLVGERGREVEALWSSGLGETRRRTALVAATSDESAAMRVQAVEQALALADRWRSEGLHVLLLLDSATRYAMALREIGLAAGEPPTVRAYTPGVFVALPRLVERCGAVRPAGAITAVMTVLSETDDLDDPITEVMKSLLDGHIVLSRRIADQGRYPAVDIARSISRLASLVMTEEHRRLAQRAVASISDYDSARTLIEAGVYAPGSNADTDDAVRRRPALENFLRQPGGKPAGLSDTMARLKDAVAT